MVIVMNDRELLEMAAKAAGIKLTSWQNVEYPKNSGIHGALYCMSHYWNPLTDDSDALRLAVKLRLEIERSKHSECVVYVGEVGAGQLFERSDEKTDIFAATRRAIVRAAAEIGRTMKE